MDVKVVAWLLLVVLPCALTAGDKSTPWVQVYTRNRGEYGRPNTLICYVKNFYPPVISVQLLKNGQVIPDTIQSDMAFTEEWSYHLTTHAAFTPNSGDKYSCRVTHQGVEKNHRWEPDV